MQKAKYDAILRNKRFVLYPSIDLSTYNNNWDTSLISFVDTNQNLQRENNEEVLTNVEFAHRYGSLKFQKFGKKLNSIVFQGDTGLPRESNGTFTYCSYNQLKNFKLILSKMGHTRLEDLKNC